MSNQSIEPHRVTKPIQLLAAWLLGLTVIDGSFLGAAVAMNGGGWERMALVVAAILNVPIFLIALFVLQTRFRIELQEDSFYFQYISQKTDTVVNVNKVDLQSVQIEALQNEILALKEVKANIAEKPSASSIDWSKWQVALNDHRPDFLEIRSALAKVGVPIEVIFGKINGSKAPQRWVIAINSHMDSAHVKILLCVLVEFDFDGFVRWEPIREGGELEDVYIGSYGNKPYTPITSEFKHLVNSDDFDEISLQYFVSNNITPASA